MWVSSLSPSAGKPKYTFDFSEEEDEEGDEEPEDEEPASSPMRSYKDDLPASMDDDDDDIFPRKPSSKPSLPSYADLHHLSWRLFVLARPCDRCVAAFS